MKLTLSTMDLRTQRRIRAVPDTRPATPFTVPMESPVRTIMIIANDANVKTHATAIVAQRILSALLIFSLIHNWVRRLSQFAAKVSLL